MAASPIALLKREHETITRMIDGLERVRDALDREETVHPKVLHKAVAFMRQFADRRHHAKEEDGLFPAMVRAGVPEHGGPIAVMKAEHDQGRAAVAALDDAAAAYAEHGPAERGGVIRAIDAIAALYPNHIFKEDNILYPMAERVLDAEAMAALAASFARIEEDFDDDEQGQLIAFAQRLDWETAGS